MSKDKITELFSICYFSIDNQGNVLSVSPEAWQRFGLNASDNILKVKHLSLINESYETLEPEHVFLSECTDKIEIGLSINNSTVDWLQLDFVQTSDAKFVLFSKAEELVAIRRLNKQLAIQDPHTGLLYREAFVTKIKELDTVGLVCCVRICNYQRISELWNIGVANLVFMEVLSRFQTEYESAIFSKYSTDCFSVYIPSTKNLNIEKLYNTLNAPFTFNGSSFYSNIALGYYKEKDNDDHELSLNKAEMATFDVLSEKLRLVEFQDTLAKQIEHQNKIETELQVTLNKNLADSFFVAFQAIHDTRSECLIGAECLMRWKMGGKLVPPDEFIPIVESSGEINKLTLFSIEQIRQLLDLLDEEEIDTNFYTFAINISVTEILDVNFEKKLLEKLAEQRLNPKKIKLELTESALIDNFSYVNNVLVSLQKKGFTIAIDDFGTGFSSLSYLCKLNFDELKIDRAFVTNVIKDAKLQSIFNSIVSLAKNLDKPIVAEGVEEMEQMIYAKAKGVNYIQGYYYSKPLAITEFVEYVLEDKSSYLHFDS